MAELSSSLAARTGLRRESSMRGEPRIYEVRGPMHASTPNPPTGQAALFVVKYAPEAGVPGLAQAERVPWNLIRFAPA